jgi:HSP20 family protein
VRHFRPPLAAGDGQPFRAGPAGQVDTLRAKEIRSQRHALSGEQVRMLLMFRLLAWSGGVASRKQTLLLFKTDLPSTPTLETNTTMRLIRYQYPRSVLPRASFVNPWANFEEEVDRVMNAAFSDFLGEATSAEAWNRPRADLYEDKDNFYFRAELAGLKKDDIHVELGDGVLTVSGQRKGFAPDGQAERTTDFSRSVSLPARVQDGSINARYEDGVLTVTLPKAEEVKPKRVAVQVK